MENSVWNSLYKLEAYCASEGYKGYDPYDGLNSRLFQAIPVIRGNRMARLACIQLFKRSPINLRPLAGVKKEYNPKALGLFLSGYCNLYQITQKQEYLDKINFFISKIKTLANSEWSGYCWGYNFDWQARAFFQPKNTPTVVATTFISCALLDAYEILGDDSLLKIARSACDFVLKDLNRTYDDRGNFAFSYSPLDKSVVYNASLLGSRLLSRVYSFTHEEELISAAKKSVVFCCDNQQNDGSWTYGKYDFHSWIDNFHTGYNLECIAEYIKYSGETDFKSNLERGFEYYINNFFSEDGIPKYYNNSIYPIDIHIPAQLVITASRLNKFSECQVVIQKVIYWTIANMQSKKGYFYFQKNKFFTSKISYMRWAQAWMFYGLSEYVRNSDVK
ncbi:MAG TPA: delta-aminolevulinic acid dehydratase [Bacteroidales bacterium]|mgnify:CR=1 FL=1|nr:delta-aminolevulinic acid dehydratase [Bacteroidales bacterium]HPT20316.1 delta-aminolevulinic acid dehydratase [Bacteroidales bacterium]